MTASSASLPDNMAQEYANAVELDMMDLPAHCPNPRMTIWSSHPRVFLDMSHGAARCPYCGTAYRLKPGAKTGAH